MVRPRALAAGLATLVGTTATPTAAFQSLGGACARIGQRSLTSLRPVVSSPRPRGSATAVTMNFWSSLTAKKEVNYEGLAGLPESFAKEAATYALRGEIPTHSKDGHAIATFAGGCFWGLELAFQRVPGVVATSVGYAQGHVEKPTYGEVCSGATGHTETVTLIYDEQAVDFETLCNVFWDRLGNDALRYHQVGADRGSQYRHGIYYNTEAQKAAADKTFQERQAAFGGRAIQTEIEPVGIAWPAEEYHQQYLEKGGRFGQPQSAAKGATETIRCYG